MKQISLNNGNTYMTAAEAIEAIYGGETRISWDTIVFYMDDEARESAVNEAEYPAECDERTEREIFLSCYLDLAETDLVIG